MPEALKLVLASTSRYRRNQLSQLHNDFLCFAPNLDETPQAGENALQLSIRLALAKARAVADEAPEKALIIGADQCAALHDEILGKPLTVENALSQLTRCSGQCVRFYSGISVLNKATGEHLSDAVITEVRFRELSRQEIEIYIERENALDCAGSFKCEGLGIALFEEIRSNDPSALVGLPLIQLNRFLLHFGFNPLLS